jgi:integrase
MVFNYAMRNQWVTRNPAKYVEHARDERPLEERPLDMDVLTPEEVEALREAATPATYRDGKLITNNYRLLISFAVFTGCRVAEILGAAWSHIDWTSGEFRVRRAFREGHFHEPKTRTSYRSIALPAFLLRELKVWRLACPKGPYDFIFPNLDGQPMSYSNLMTRGFHPALKRAGAEFPLIGPTRFPQLGTTCGAFAGRCARSWEWSAMSRCAGFVWFLGELEIRGGVRSPLCGLPVQPIFRPRPSTPRFRVCEPLSPNSWPLLPHPSWATTKERAAWRFGA